MPTPYQQELSPNTELYLNAVQNGATFETSSLGPSSPGAKSVTSSFDGRPLTTREIVHIKEGPHFSHREEVLNKAGAHSSSIIFPFAY
jgi:hypothetical protein